MGKTFVRSARFLPFLVFLAIAASPPQEEGPFDRENRFIDEHLATLTDTSAGVMTLQLALANLGEYGITRREEVAARIAPFLQEAWDPRVRSAAITALGNLHAHEYVASIGSGLKETDPFVVGAAAHALGKLAPYAPEAAAKYADDVAATLEDPSFTESKIYALGQMRAGQHADLIASYLDMPDEDGEIHARALEALGRIGATEHAGKVAAFLKNDNPALRVSALNSLKAMKGAGQEEEMAKLLDDPVPDVAVAAVGAMREIGGGTPDARIDSTVDRLKDAIGQALDSGDSDAVTKAILLLAELGAKEFAGKIAEKLKDKDGWLAKAALFALGLLGATEHLDEAREMENHSHLGVRKEARKTVGILSKQGADPAEPGGVTGALTDLSKP